MADLAYTLAFLGIDTTVPSTNPFAAEGQTLATRFVPGGTHRSCVEEFLGSKKDEIWRAGGRRDLAVAWGLGLIRCVGIVGRVCCRVRRVLGRMDGLSTLKAYTRFFFLPLFHFVFAEVEDSLPGAGCDSTCTLPSAVLPIELL